jgi:hypothetical protein
LFWAFPYSTTGGRLARNFSSTIISVQFPPWHSDHHFSLVQEYNEYNVYQSTHPLISTVRTPFREPLDHSFFPLIRARLAHPGTFAGRIKRGIYKKHSPNWLFCPHYHAWPRDAEELAFITCITTWHSRSHGMSYSTGDSKFFSSVHRWSPINNICIIHTTPIVTVCSL